jgi:hypothetical protein
MVALRKVVPLKAARLRLARSQLLRDSNTVEWYICPNCICRKLGFVSDPVDGIGLIPND